MEIKCCDWKDYIFSLKDKSVNLFFLDPPFGIGEEKFGSQYNRNDDNVINGYSAFKGDYSTFICNLLEQCEGKLVDNGSILLFCAWNKLNEVFIALNRYNSSLLFEERHLIVVNHLIWHYNFGVYTKHKFVCSHYHILWIAKEGYKPYFNQFGVHNTTKEAYHDLQDVLIFKKEFQHGGKKNINKLPSKLVEHLIKLTTKQGDVVCDLFAGSFIVPKVAEQLGRVGIGCEFNLKCFFDTNWTQIKLNPEL